MYKLLIIEDETIIRKWLRYSVPYTDLGFTVVGEASDGEEGVDKIKKLQPHVVLTDIHMPKKNGFEVFNSVKELCFEKVIISGYDSFENAKKSIQHGVVDFIAKPIDREELISILKHIKGKLDNNCEDPETIIERLLGNDFKIDTYSVITEKIIEWIKGNLTSTFNIHEIANELNYSESYLYKIFKEDTGFTINQFRTNCRIEYAVRIIMYDPNVKLYEVAEEIGFQDVYYFSQVFKKITGISPKEFKTSIVGYTS